MSDSKGVITLKSLLESIAPGGDFHLISGDETRYVEPRYPGRRILTLKSPTLELECSECEGVRTFQPTNIFKIEGDASRGFLSYKCRNCQKTEKDYALVLIYDETLETFAVFKIGELPSFERRLPTRVISLMGKEKELFLKAWRAEKQGFGIGAFGYYRRVVEQLKDHLFDEMIKVAKVISAPAEMIQQLTAAKVEYQFGKAIGSVDFAIPDVLKIDDHNPMLLLYQALSDVLHNADEDDEALVKARSVRLVLSELAERLHALKRDNTELKKALSTFLK